MFNRTWADYTNGFWGAGSGSTVEMWFGNENTYRLTWVTT